MNIQSQILEQENRVHTALMKGHFFPWLFATMKLERLQRKRTAPVRVSMIERVRQWRTRNRVYTDSHFVNVFFYIGDRRKVVQVDPEWSFGEIAYMNDLPVLGTWWSYNGRPLRMTATPHDYDIGNNSNIIITGRLLGGTRCPLPLYTIITECENMVLHTTHTSLCDFRLQAEAISDGEPIMDLITRVLEKHRTSCTKDAWIIDLLENFVQLLYWSSKCETKTDVIASIALAYKLFTGRSVVNASVGFLCVESLQGDAFSDITKTAREWFTLGASALKNPLFERMRKIYTYLLVQGFLTKMGLTIGEQEFLTLDARARVKYNDKTSLVMLMIDTAITICERIEAYRITGDWHSFVHDDVHYTKWNQTADRLISLAPFTSNLEAHGTSYFAFIADLNDAVEKGETMCKYTSKSSGVDPSGIRRKLNTLQLLKNTEITRRASQKERRAPFGVLIHGASSVAKSSFTKMLFYFYGQVHGLSTDDHYRYVRNPAEDYWNNFDSSKWCIQLDDIAFLLPQKSSDVDPTLKDLLNVVNNVPYVPAQAALEDKGKTPVMAKLVLATTNAPDLNAQDYFHCPLAVRRRLPYIVKVEPKEEYKHANGKFIDPTKLEKPTCGFPNYWIITVQQIVPEEHNGRDSARLETIEVFTDVRKFLAHFGEKTKEHEKIQTKAEVADTYMRDIVVCPLCCSIKEECTCLQALIVPTWSVWFWRYVAAEVGRILYWMLINLFSSWIGMWLTKFYVMRHTTVRLTRFLSTEHEVRVLGLLNGGRGYGFRVTMGRVAAVALLVGQVYVSWKCASYIYTKPTQTQGVKATVNSGKPERVSTCSHCVPTSSECESEELSDEENIDGDIHSLGLQGNVHGTTEEQLVKEQSKNVWYNSAIELSQFDIPLASRSLANLEPSSARDLFAANCVLLEFQCRDVHFKYRVKGVFIKGQRLIFNRHALKNGTDFALKIITEPTSCGITSNFTTYFKRHEVTEVEEVDLVGLTVLDVPPRKDITKFWNVSAVPITRMVGVSRTVGGTAEYVELFNVSFQPHLPVAPLNREMHTYLAKSSVLTQDGDCGTLGIGLTPRGPVIIGVHTLGHGEVRGYPHVSQTHLRKLLGNTPLVEGGGSPLFDLQGNNTQPGRLHPRSVVRYLETGTANVYGGLPGGRPKPRSRVCGTPLQQEMLEELGGVVNYGEPVMTGWEPVHNNIKEMVLQHADVDHDVLEHCVRTYVQDIVTQLDSAYGDDWKRELVFLTDRAAVNGLAGVKYIDRINVSTSMGFPWNTSKKQFLHPDPSADLPEGVTFTDEVWERVRHVEQCYVEGRRAYPVFTAHLKDEATSFAKIEKKKTRVFTGAPIDFSIVGRKKLLSFVRLLQKNKLIFEAAPGTVTQSKEWTHFYQYLTQHGEKKLVAGDYGKFDKRMLARFILMAFEVIIEVHRSAGFSEDELQEIRCIGTDIAFPVCNFQGDIIEFFGTNPSGHPFTVVVNSLVNSLYMRYAYCMLNPIKTSWDFRQNVALLTYGDDNVMGVSHTVPWFNHTAIQEVLASIGVEYTMADKEAASVPYISIDEVSFLKRKWRWETELNAYAAPLEVDSIQKSLTVWVPSRTIDKYKQMVDVITSANNEFFFHGRELFEKRRSFFQRVLQQEPYSHYVEDSTLPDWDTLVERFRHASQEFENVPVPGLGLGCPVPSNE